jgi:colicin import membrane protein
MTFYFKQTINYKKMKKIIAFALLLAFSLVTLDLSAQKKDKEDKPKKEKKEKSDKKDDADKPKKEKADKPKKEKEDKVEKPKKEKADKKDDADTKEKADKPKKEKKDKEENDKEPKKAKKSKDDAKEVKAADRDNTIKPAPAKSTKTTATPQAAPAKQRQVAGEDKVFGKDDKGRTIYEGPRGGRYYINANGNKTYIQKEN